jgi:hypothetical protein
MSDSKVLTTPIKCGRYAVVDLSGYIPQKSCSGYELAYAEFTAIEQAKAVAYSRDAFALSDGSISIGLWLGSSRGWTWLKDCPWPSKIVRLELRDGCANCGSLGHGACNNPIADHKPEPPCSPQSITPPAYAPVGTQPPHSRVREWVDPHEQMELDEICRTHPDLVRMARGGTSSSVEAARAVRNQLRAAKKEQEANHAAS